SPPFTIDLTPPSATVTANYTVFSPNGDGNKDFITFTQTTSEEQTWKGVVMDSGGKPVRTVTWRGKADTQFVWDGHGGEGRLLPDGKYTYFLEATDKAGNYGKSASVSFEINTAETPVLISTDLTYFSPNGDGVKDTLHLLPTLKVAAGVASYRISILDKAGIIIRGYRGSGPVPKDIVWDGKDQQGISVPDGRYSAGLNVLYRNGNNPTARSNPFFVDTAYPNITVSVSGLLFSPDGDGRLDTITIMQTSSKEDLWEGDFLSSDGQIVRGYFWKEKAPDFSWDGRDNNGNVVPDGSYSYIVKATDRAGNQTMKRIGGIVVDTRPTPISIGASSEGLSPNGDGVRDSIGFSLSVGLKSGIRSWRVEMISANAGVQKVFSDTGAVPGTLYWDGKTGKGTMAVQGVYRARMTVDYLKGNQPQASSGPFLLSVTPPKVTIGLAPLPFSPDGDGINDILTISLTASDPSPIVSWDATILDPREHFFESFSGKGAPPKIIKWNGLSADGELVQAAEDYPLTITVQDELGNIARITKLIPIDVLVIREGNKLKVRVSSITFAPNTADYIDVPPGRAARNMKTLKRLAEIFRKYSQYDIRIEGYAVMVYWNDPRKGKLEQKQVLIPLSKARAEAIKAALVKLGLDADHITTVGLGGADPIVPFSDMENRWKDRRVEFILIRNSAGGS
ncbi:MAG: OmpA family protein, partial [Spirochaetes bacterium]|nr:OmpA family protein [Spirochaetota bacterium]